MVKIYLDPGHGGSDSGASANGMHEKDIVLDIGLRIRDMLRNEYEGVEIRMSRTTDRSVTLAQRTSDANSWGADYFVSIHVNAFNGSARGYEDFIHNSLSDSSQTARYRDIMHEEITKVNDLVNRGKKKANFHVLRETRMSAILTENGFIDNAQDAAKLRDPNWLERVARGHVNGIARAFNLTRRSNSGGGGSNGGGNGNGDLYRVIVDGTQEGAYRMRQNILDAVDRNLDSANEVIIRRVD
ncbi:N-acetylmuramoyl-L-alanine amidase family protein [Halalkalibacter okhensis]|uniref:N-acetylmuramoyl-L-alanine amidase n=1 Tax=Halalkalibacter okhensis TaxID=333138 RepID=A0A0B0IF34_9BACI|nr:N-acetylmuramoyl-L-alanine amidase [Halalkalibacter okhensis]KHF38689.1 N-acetylmuramoyl-L-alanine amidase [Halalkalibacter okhensis]